MYQSLVYWLNLESFTSNEKDIYLMKMIMQVKVRISEVIWHNSVRVFFGGDNGQSIRFSGKLTMHQHIKKECISFIAQQEGHYGDYTILQRIRLLLHDPIPSLVKYVESIQHVFWDLSWCRIYKQNVFQ